MFETYVFPELGGLAGETVFRKKILKVSGLGESAVDEAIAPVYTNYKKCSDFRFV